MCVVCSVLLPKSIWFACNWGASTSKKYTFLKRRPNRFAIEIVRNVVCRTVQKMPMGSLKMFNIPSETMHPNWCTLAIYCACNVRFFFKKKRKSPSNWNAIKVNSNWIPTEITWEVFLVCSLFSSFPFVSTVCFISYGSIYTRLLNAHIHTHTPIMPSI